MILVTGAAGKTGQAIIRALVSRGQSVRAAVFRPNQLKGAVELGADEAVAGDILDLGFLARAARGIRSIYHICPNVHPLELEMGRAVAEAAVKAGVQHVAYHSVMHPQTERMPHHWKKMRVEELLFKCGLPYTILQPAAYMQNILGAWKMIELEGRYVVPYPAETRISIVDLVDVAEAAAIVLTVPGHEGATYELAGPEPLSQYEVGERLGEHLARPVRVVPISIVEWRDKAQAINLSQYQVDTLACMFDYYARYGFAGNPNVLGWLLGRKPTDLATFLQRMLS